MWKWIKQRKAVIAAVSLNIVILLPAIVLSACNPGTFIMAKTPDKVAEVLGVPVWSSLNSAESNATMFIAWVDAQMTLMNLDLEGPRYIRALIVSTRDVYLDMIVNQDGTFNLAGLLPFAGIGILGLALRRPGDSQREEKRVGREIVKAKSEGGKERESQLREAGWIPPSSA